ncbi:MFS general substrate transporter [Ascodesmis nigricans]|uniref:MFS general substrate transporter n=1 Tax=Ascodesmis nigricans TaxID=341454 RepID=A0A4S2MZY3_9PEZI|nr:MFS general substrate transporter [Ascodesmis nigricans]
MERRDSTPHYQTFSTEPPQSRGHPRGRSFWKSRGSRNSFAPEPSSQEDDGNHKSENGSLPTRQLIVLAFISLAEQTALNSISPYLPAMAASFPEVDQKRVGLYVGAIASSFAAAQFSTNVFWGRISDRIGRKPVIVVGTFLTALCFFAFGFCRRLWQAIVVQALMGIVNANAGIVSTVLGEITDSSNQSTAFAYLPIVYGIGSIIGPIFGGLMVNVSSGGDILGRFPYLLPNVVAFVILILDLIVCIFFLEESLKDIQDLPPLTSRLRCAFTWLWQFMASSRPSYLRNTHTNYDTDSNSDESEFPSYADACPAIIPDSTSSKISYKEVLIPQIIILLLTYTIFNLSNIAYNSLYPIYLSTPRPIGRDLLPKEIGLSLGFGGAIAIVFQGFFFSPLQTRLGSLWVYRLAFAGFVFSFFAMPFVGRNPHDPKWGIWAELGFTVLVKNIATVGGLTCAMLMITNASPKPNTLGMLNGMAQSLSAGGRAIGPLVSGGLFTLSMGVKKDSEFLSWGVFGAIAVVGTVLSCFLKGANLESRDAGREPLLRDEESGTGQ